MDPRGAPARLLEDPAGALDALAAAAGVRFPSLTAARADTERRLGELRAALADLPAAERTAVVVFGSWARGEWTEYSDDDWALLAEPSAASDDPGVAAALARAGAVLGVAERSPGEQPAFGTAFGCDELVERIGLDDDTNTNLTRRMLLLLESRTVAGAAHPRCWARVLDAYLDRGARDHEPPRFLLNDVVRYWRTICVDFEGKHRDTGGDDPKWVARNAKLRTSRKLLFAGGLVPVLLCQLKEASAVGEFLRRQLAAPPTDRLAAAFVALGAVDEGARALGAYDRWIELLRSAGARAELAGLREATRDASPLFREIRALGRQLEDGLLALLFETELAPLARRYAVF